MVVEERTIELTLISAVDLKKVKKFGREQKNYVVAYIYPSHKETTLADPYGGINPNWNAKVNLKCYESHVRALPTPASSSSPATSYGITMDIYCHSHSLGGHGGDKLVGTVTVPLHEIAAVVDKHGTFSKSFVILRPSGAPQGTLNISVKFGAKRELGEFEDPTGARFGSESSEKV